VVRLGAGAGAARVGVHAGGGSDVAATTTTAPPYWALPHAHLATPAYIAATLDALGVTALRTARVVHCPRAYALRLEGAAPEAPGGAPRPWSLLYSGDTRPCAEVAALARGGGARAPLAHAGAAAGDAAALAAGAAAALARAPAPAAAAAAAAAARPAALLIHEATFEDTPEGRANAMEKRHSTVGEALAVAAAGRVGFTLLTHFSARYPKVPVLKQQAAPGEGATPPRVFVAYDLAAFNGAQLLRAPRLLPALHAIFKADEEEGEEGEA
jgi:hypothetical protein